jgi:hypothetical protein
MIIFLPPFIYQYACSASQKESKALTNLSDISAFKRPEWHKTVRVMYDYMQRH